MRRQNNAGFALIGTLVAASLATVMLALVQRVVPRKPAAPKPTLTSILAEQKLEELRGLTWGSLRISPPGALQQNISGFVEYLDARGVVLGEGFSSPEKTRYTRRWSIEPLRSRPEDALVLQVLVSTSGKRSTAAQLPVRLTALKTRNATVNPLER